MSIQSSLGIVGCRIQFPGELPANRDPHEHPHAGLLGQQRLARGPHSPPRGLGQRLADLRLVGVPEPAALLERVGEHALELRREHQGALGAGEALGVGQGLDSGLHLLVREHGRDTRAGQVVVGAGGREPPDAI